MFEILLPALVLTAVAGLWDLKTTEVPDEIPAIMIVSGIAFWLIDASITGNLLPLAISLTVGSLLLAFGLALYKKGQWGGADAWILAAVGYMVPLYAGSLFIIPYIFNFLIVSAAYMIVYALVLGVKNRRVFPLFAKDLKENKKVFILPFAFLAFLLAFGYFVSSLGYRTRFLPALEIFLLVFLLMVFWRYGRVIERHVLRKRVPASGLKAGDVLDGMKWVGLTRQQVSAVRKKKRFVTIKEGVRFVPVFFLSLMVTLLYGNLFFLLLGI